MISNTTKTILVDGVHKTNIGYKHDNNGTMESDISGSLMVVSDGQGSYIGANTIVITGEIKGYLIKNLLLHEASVYSITGVANPGDTIVYLSSYSEKGNLDELKNNVISTTYADSEGNFEFKNIFSENINVALWISSLAQDATTASLTYELSITDFNPAVGSLLTYDFIKLEEDYIDRFENPLYTISGFCSEDIETVYVSKADNAMSITYLMETMVSSVSPKDQSFFIECGGEYDQNYIIWALSKTTNGTLEINYIDVSEDTSVCLSGNTMITMADGSSKRMDNICAGDVVLSKDGVTSVNTVRRGRFNDNHILYHFEDGTVIDETHHHRFYNTDQGFWQRLQLWNIGDHAINCNGEEVALMSVERLDEKAEMFGIWTDDGTYYANGLLSGAASCNKELLAEATVEQAIDMMLSTEEEMLVELLGLGGVLP